jgi:putative tryptophan/tyrosine transport system substrate-binding protein
MKRREFITLLGGAAAAWPLAARAQQAAMPVVGFLSSRSRQDSADVLAAWLQGLSETGHTEGRNIAIEYRWAEGRYDRLPAQAAELVRLHAAVIVAVGGNIAALPAKAATSMIPIVFIVGSDPVRDGLVESLARPGGNVTGVTLFTSDLGPKRLGLLRELVPVTAVIAVLLNPSSAAAPNQVKEMQDAARAIGQPIVLLRATNEREIDAAFAALVEHRSGALVVMPDPFFNTRREQLIALASHYAVPAIYESREYAIAGGLMSYGTSYADTYRQAGIYTGRILKGATPTDLPVLQPTKFDLIVNLKTAKALGLAVPVAMQQLADEVIE